MSEHFPFICLRLVHRYNVSMKLQGESKKKATIKFFEFLNFLSVLNKNVAHFFYGHIHADYKNDFNSIPR